MKYMGYEKAKLFSRVQLFVTPWTVACQASLSMGFSRQKYWSGLPFPSPGDLLDPRTESASPALQADSLPLSHLGNLFILFLICKNSLVISECIFLIASNSYFINIISETLKYTVLKFSSISSMTCFL